MLERSQNAPPRSDAMAQSVAAVRARFIASLADRAAELDTLMALADAEADPRKLLVRATEIVHRIAGVAGTLGFADLGNLAFEAERQLGLALSAPQALASAEPAVTAVDRVVGYIDEIILQGQASG